MKKSSTLKKRYVLKNKKRFAAFISVLLVFSIFMIFTTTVYSYKSQQYETIKVRQGDTLWTIAEKYSQNSDVRKVVFDIKQANKLTGSEILAGDEIKIPVQ